MEMMLEQFKTIFDRPEKVKKLREAILDLAVKGKLVPQDPSEEPASVLLEKIKEEKERLIKEKKIKKEKPLAEIREEEKPFELPEGWEWVRLGESFRVITGKSFNSSDFFNEGTGIKSVKITNVGVGQFIETEGDLLPENFKTTFTEFRINRNDILLALTRPYIKDGLKVCRCSKEYEGALLNQRVAVVKNLISNEKLLDYIFIYLKSESVLNYIKLKCTATGQPNLSMNSLNNLIIPMPNIKEQNRIVEKVDFLMTFCDKLEEALKKKVHYGELSAKSVFNAVGNVSTVEKLEETLRFILLHFKDLSLGDSAVKELKNCILQLAVQGKLVQQNPEDEPVEVLLEKIKEKKARLVKEGKIKKEKALEEIGEEEKLFELPRGWEFFKISEISYFINGDRSSKYPNESDLVNDGVPFFGAMELHDSILNYDSTLRFISKEKFDSLGGGKLRNNDIVVLLRGAGLGRSGIFYKNDKYETGFINAQMVIIRLINEAMNKYVIRFLESNLYKNQIQSTGSAITQLPAHKLKEVIIPVPPLAEQKRIVEKVDALMTLCDELENEIQKQREYSERLMEAILKGAF